MTTEGVREKSKSDPDRRRGDESPKGTMNDSGFPHIAEEDAVSGLMGLRDPSNVIRDDRDSALKNRMKRSDRVAIPRVPIHALNPGKKNKKLRSKSGAPRSDEGARGSAAKEIFASGSNPSRDSENLPIQEDRGKKKKLRSKSGDSRSDKGARGSAVKEIFASGSNPSRDSENLPIQEDRSDEGARGSGSKENFVSSSNPEGRYSEKHTEEDSLESFETTDGDEEDYAEDDLAEQTEDYTTSLRSEGFEETDGDEEDRERGLGHDEEVNAGDDLEDKEDDAVLKDKSTGKRKKKQSSEKKKKRQRTLVPLPLPVDISIRRVVRSVVIKPGFFLSNSLFELMTY